MQNIQKEMAEIKHKMSNTFNKTTKNPKSDDKLELEWYKSEAL